MDQEPLAIGGYLPLKKVYDFNPDPEELNTEAAKHILGGQANLWTEYVSDLKHAEYMTFPRIAALTEALWSPKETRNWEDFSRRIQQFIKRYDQMGINYSKNAYQVSAKAQIDPEKKQLAVSLKSELADVEIHYTTNGTEPTNLSPVYSEPNLLDKTTTFKAITLAHRMPFEKILSVSFNINKATVKPIKYLVPFSEYYQGTGEYSLVNGVRGTTNHRDGDWQGWVSTNMEVVIDLQETTEILSISVGSLHNDGALIFFPKKVEVFVSAEGTNFKKVGETLNGINPISGEKQLKDFKVSFNPASAHFVKVVASNLGKVPKGYASEGKAAWLFVDEIAVE